MIRDRRSPPIGALLLALAAASSGCAPAAAPCPPEAPSLVSAPSESASLAEEQKAISRVLDDWHLAASKADEEAYFGLLAEGAVFLGTDATERWDKKAFRDYAHPHFAKGKAWSFRAARRVIVIAPGGASAWFDEDLATERLGPARGSGALVKTKDGWRIAHYDLSIPIPNERFDAVKKLIAEPAAPAP